MSVALRGALKDKQSRQERNRQQQALAGKIEELARSNADLEQFAYVASHDLQEPLRMVSAYTQLLAERYHGKLDEQADKYITYAVDGAARMQSLIRDLLAFSRVGRQGDIAPDHGLQRNRRAGSARPGSGDPGKRSHSHSRAFSPVNGQQFATQTGVPEPCWERPQIPAVSETPVIHISAEKRGADWIFSVADNGIGICAEHAESIFIIFNRLHTRTEYPGNGIGLAISKKIIERHGGTIQAIPHEGGGTIFKFTLPAGKPAPSQDSA